MASSNDSSRNSANACSSRRSDSDSDSVAPAVSANGVERSPNEAARSATPAVVTASAANSASEKGFCSD